MKLRRLAYNNSTRMSKKGLFENNTKSKGRRSTLSNKFYSVFEVHKAKERASHLSSGSAARWMANKVPTFPNSCLTEASKASSRRLPPCGGQADVLWLHPEAIVDPENLSAGAGECGPGCAIVRLVDSRGESRSNSVGLSSMAVKKQEKKR